MAGPSQSGASLPRGEDLERSGAGPPPRAARSGRSSGEARPTNSYNARHQQAEARRRSRINERLEALRQLVPHTERANTANFLEEVVAYVQRLQGRIAELERQLGMQPTVRPPERLITFSEDTSEPTLQTMQRDDRRAVLSQAYAPPPGMAQPAPQPPALPPMIDTATAQAAIAALLAQQQQAQQAQQAQQQAQLGLMLQQALQAQNAQRFGPTQAVPGLSSQPLAQQASQQAQHAQHAPHQSQVSSDSRRLLHTGAVAADSAAGGQQSAGLLALAAADSFGCLSGDGSLRSGSQAPKDAGGQGGGNASTGTPADPASAPACAAGQPLAQQQAKRDDVTGIPTDEELEMLHEQLLAQQENKRRRVAG